MRAREALQGVDRVIVHNLTLETCQLPNFPRDTQATLKRCLIQRARRERHVYRNELCESWLQGEDYAYVMYNDADLVLHARCIKSLGKAMDEDQTLIILPHKLQTFAKDDDPLPELGVAPSVRDLTHDVDSASCCDSGTYPALTPTKAFDGCQNFWYNCPWMLASMTRAFGRGRTRPCCWATSTGASVCCRRRGRPMCRRDGLAAQRQYLVPLLALGRTTSSRACWKPTVANSSEGLYYSSTSTPTIGMRTHKKRNSRTSSTQVHDFTPSSSSTKRNKAVEDAEPRVSLK